MTLKFYKQHNRKCGGYIQCIIKSEEQAVLLVLILILFFITP